MKYIVLLRAINVAGQRKLPMAELVALTKDIGIQKVKHYIQSGNLVVETPLSKEEIKMKLEAEIVRVKDFHTEVFVFDREQWSKAIDQAPNVDDWKKLYVCFTMNPLSKVNLEELNRYSGELVTIGPQGLYIYYAHGMGKAKLSNAFIEKKIGCPTTSRNWNTTQKMLDLLDAL